MARRASPGRSTLRGARAAPPAWLALRGGVAATAQQGEAADRCRRGNESSSGFIGAGHRSPPVISATWSEASPGYTPALDYSSQDALERMIGAFPEGPRDRAGFRSRLLQPQLGSAHRRAVRPSGWGCIWDSRCSTMAAVRRRSRFREISDTRPASALAHCVRPHSLGPRAPCIGDGDPSAARLDSIGTLSG